jgi:hypothetical protein
MAPNISQAVSAPQFHGFEALFERYRTAPIGEWAAYTPTFSSADGASLGNGQTVGMYTRIGRTCLVQGRWLSGSTTNYGAGAPFAISLPFAISDEIHYLPLGTCMSYNGANGSVYPGVALNRAWYYGGGNSMQMVFTAPVGYVGSTNPFTWSPTGGQLLFALAYQLPTGV